MLKQAYRNHARPPAVLAKMPQGIPAVAGTAPPPRRKKMQSATLDSRLWIGNGLRDSAAANGAKKAPLRGLSELLLPCFALGIIEGKISFSAIADFVIILTSHFGTQLGLTLFATHFALRTISHLTTAFNFPVRLAWSVLLAALFVLFGHSERLYLHELTKQRTAERNGICKTAFWSSLIFGAVLLASGEGASSLAILGISSVMSFFLINGRRDRRRQCTACDALREPRNVLVVGAGKFGREIARQIEQAWWKGEAVRGFLDNREPVCGDVLGRFNDLPRIAREHFIDEVVLAIPDQRNQAEWLAHVARSKQLDVMLAPDLLGFAAARTENSIAEPPLLCLHAEPVPAVGPFVKRLLDVSTSTAALAFLAPAMAAIALLLKMTSPGPVLYCAPRVGKKGRCFTCYKFRTMVTNADALKHDLRASNDRDRAFFKLKDDPRVTRLGRILRRYSLDELPQLWNVLLGDMSMVGPRPHPIDDFQRYELADLRRLDVTPGITGLWQVTARSDPSFERNVELDVEYIRQWNLWMDLKILLKTVSAVLQGGGV